MVLIIERVIQEVYGDKMKEIEEINKKYTELERKYGWPEKKRFRCIAGPYDINTVILERQWSSLARMEKGFTKLYLDPEANKLLDEAMRYIKTSRTELYTPHFVLPSDVLKE